MDRGGEFDQQGGRHQGREQVRDGNLPDPQEPQGHAFDLLREVVERSIAVAPIKALRGPRQDIGARVAYAIFSIKFRV